MPVYYQVLQVSSNRMKTTIVILAIITIILFISCGDANEKKTVVASHGDTTLTFIDKKEEEKRKQIQHEKLDSINDDKVLSEAIKIAEQWKAQDRFKKTYVATIPDS